MSRSPLAIPASLCHCAANNSRARAPPWAAHGRAAARTRSSRRRGRQTAAIGRKDPLAELQSWLDDETDISVYGLIGRAGTGKTRLAIEFCRTIDSDPSGKGEWIAGFLSPADLSPVVETLATHSFIWERRTLLVIDYAAQCHQALAHWLDRLADQKLDAKLRFLLLDREAPEAFGWWQDLTVLGPPSRRGLFHELRPRQLPDLSDLEERRALMTAACRPPANCEQNHRVRGPSGEERSRRFRPPPRPNPVRQSAEPGHGRGDRARPRPTCGACLAPPRRCPPDLPPRIAHG